MKATKSRGLGDAEVRSGRSPVLARKSWMRGSPTGDSRAAVGLPSSTTRSSSRSGSGRGPTGRSPRRTLDGRAADDRDQLHGRGTTYLAPPARQGRQASALVRRGARGDGGGPAPSATLRTGSPGRPAGRARTGSRCRPPAGFLDPGLPAAGAGATLASVRAEWEGHLPRQVGRARLLPSDGARRTSIPPPFRIAERRRPRRRRRFGPPAGSASALAWHCLQSSRSARTASGAARRARCGSARTSAARGRVAGVLVAPDAELVRRP